MVVEQSDVNGQSYLKEATGNHLALLLLEIGFQEVVTEPAGAGEVRSQSPTRS